MTETPDYVPRRLQQSSRPLPANANCRDHAGYNAARCPICSHEIRTRQRSPRQRGQRIRTIVAPPAGLLERLRRQNDQKGAL